jgi:hypothetical protein
MVTSSALGCSPYYAALPEACDHVLVFHTEVTLGKDVGDAAASLAGKMEATHKWGSWHRTHSVAKDEAGEVYRAAGDLAYVSYQGTVLERDFQSFYRLLERFGRHCSLIGRRVPL